MVAEHLDLSSEPRDSPDKLYHKGQALQFVNARLLKDKKFMSDANITAVAVLVSFEVSLYNSECL